MAPLNGSGVGTVKLNLGQLIVQGTPTNNAAGVSVPTLSVFPTTTANAITLQGTAGFDHFIVSGVNPGTNNLNQQIQVLDEGVTTFFIGNSLQAKGDTLTIDGAGGGDTLDASGLGVRRTRPTCT